MSDPFAANVCGARRRVVLATVVGGEHRPKPIGGAWARRFEDPSTRLVYLIRPALEGMRHATAALFSPDHPAADDIDAAYEALFTLVVSWRTRRRHTYGSSRRFGRRRDCGDRRSCPHQRRSRAHGQLAREVTDIARTRRAWASIPAPLLGVLRELSEVCLDMAFKQPMSWSHTAKSAWWRLDRGDENGSITSRRCLRSCFPLSAGIDVDAAIDLTLAARAYQRYAEHAVAVAHRAALLAVGAPRN